MQISVGQKTHREAKITEEMVRSYAEITGDYNPLHFDLEFTGRTRFERLIVQGRHYHRASERACRDGYAWTRHRFHEPELDIPQAGLHWRHDSC